jgi:hypothetical protein
MFETLHATLIPIVSQKKQYVNNQCIMIKMKFVKYDDNSKLARLNYQNETKK